MLFEDTALRRSEARLWAAATFWNTRSKSGLGCSAPTSRAMSMKRFNFSGSSGAALGFRGMLRELITREPHCRVGRCCRISAIFAGK